MQKSKDLESLQANKFEAHENTFFFNKKSIKQEPNLFPEESNKNEYLLR